MESLIFYFFSTLAVASASMVILSKNAVRSVLYLIFTFFCMAGLWMLLQSEFLAIVLVLVYVGAVMVLFLFVVMMLDIEAPIAQGALVRYWPLGLLMSGLLLSVMVFIVGKHHFGIAAFPLPPALPSDYSHVKALGRVLYTDFLVPFEVAGTLLLVAMIAAIGLTFRGTRSVRTQRADEQIRVTKHERLRIVHVPAQVGEKS